MGQGGKTFHPFYERLAAPFPGYMIGEFVVSIGLGLVFLATHYAVMGAEIFRDCFRRSMKTTFLKEIRFLPDIIKSVIP